MEVDEYLQIEDNNLDDNLPNNIEENNIYNAFDPEEWVIEEDIFEDKNIDETIKKYNYDYKTLMRELTTFIDKMTTPHRFHVAVVKNISNVVVNKIAFAIFFL